MIAGLPRQSGSKLLALINVDGNIPVVRPALPPIHVGLHRAGAGADLVVQSALRDAEHLGQLLIGTIRTK